jgi:hypothetical protein
MEVSEFIQGDYVILKLFGASRLNGPNLLPTMREGPTK